MRHSSWTRFPALVVAVLVSAGIATTAVADPSTGPTSGSAQSPAYPSKQQVLDAQKAVTDKAAQIAAIEAVLEQATRQLEEVTARAEQAAEAYNGARWELSQAKAALKQAEKDSQRAQAKVDQQRTEISALVTQSYINGGDLNVVNAFIDADGPESVMNKYLAFEGASNSMDAAYQRFEASTSVARTFEDQKRVAADEQKRLTSEEKEKAQAAQALAAEAAQVAEAVAGQREVAIQQLAEAQNISVTLATQRQTALEEIARKKREAEARHRAEVAAQRAAEEAARKAAAEEAARKAAEAAEAAAKKKTGSSGGATGTGTTPAAPVKAPPVPEGNAGTAIEFAKAQLGDMYLWGAAGPERWDCSGLTMKAWAAGGVSLPHYSVAQYDATARVSVTDLQPGDLIVYGYNSNPNSIHHVALYLGNNQIIHAPSSGKPVQISSMYFSSSSTMYFGRV